ncbi:MAG: 4-(cytidine 5'-diphospho)-2-C-methyl-D-erythritol kinase [Dehalococcoidia bacterium]|nr:4-(cytidine 5'-diphospho)-2-C-methyl-D-erythritol kinase [Dehalococcoidia bacterium]
MITIDAHAKLNLTLEVLGKRDDGYHDVASIMQTLDLADTLTIQPADSLNLACSLPGLSGPGNLAFRAAELLRTETGIECGADIHIEKRIPVAAGLGGGSADAAATLVGLNRLWGLELSNDRLRHIGGKLGSDVPFLVEGGTATALGRGERVRRLPTPSLPWIVVAVADANLPDKTAAMYRSLTPDNFTRGALTFKLEARILHHDGDVPPQLLFNTFDTVARTVIPDVDRCWNDMYAAGAREIHVSGSGPAIYAAVQRKEIATTVQLVMERIKGWRSLVTRAWPNPDAA